MFIALFTAVWLKRMPDLQSAVKITSYKFSHNKVMWC